MVSVGDWGLCFRGVRCDFKIECYVVRDVRLGFTVGVIAMCTCGLRFRLGFGVSSFRA